MKPHIFSDRLSRILPSATLEMTAKASELSRLNKPVYNMSVGEPDFPTPKNIQNAGIYAIQNGITKYTPGSGTYDLKLAIQTKLKRDNNLNYELDEIVVSCGGKHSLYNACQVLFQAGDEVIIFRPYWVSFPDFVSVTGAKPVFVNTDLKKQFEPDFSDLKRKINKKTKAIIPVHISGRAADMESIIKISKKKNINIVEDAAEAFMSKYKGKYLGTIGRLGCFSLTASKTITTGQGGIIVTNDTKLYKKILLLKNQGISGKSNGGNVIHQSVGWNFKFTNLQAAMGLAQLLNIKQRISKLKANNEIYRKELKSIKNIKILDFNLSKGEVPLWTDVYCKNRDQLILFLEKKGIECRKFWYPMHTQKPFKLNKKNFRVSSQINNKLFWLPSSLTLTKKEILLICGLIKSFLLKNK